MLKKIIQSILVALALTAGVGMLVPVHPTPAIAQEAPLYGGILTKTLTTANTEYSLGLPNGTASFTVQARGSADVKVSFTSGASGTTYFTVKSGNAYYETNVSSFNNALYMQSATAGTVVEVVYWYNG